MTRLQLSAEDLLVGSEATYDVAVSRSLLGPADASRSSAAAGATEVYVRLRPITIGQFMLIMKAAREDAGLIPLLMIKESLVEPEMSLGQIKQMNIGVVRFLVGQIRAISGLSEKKSP